MKKAAAILSFILYLAATCGIVINSHYCMKKLVSVHFYEQKAKSCGLCGMDMHDNNGCCHDEVKVVKLVQDQLTTDAFVLTSPQALPASVIYSDYLFTPLLNGDKHVFSQFHSPPLLSMQDTYLRINVFRI